MGAPGAAWPYKGRGLARGPERDCSFSLPASSSLAAAGPAQQAPAVPAPWQQVSFLRSSSGEGLRDRAQSRDCPGCDRIWASKTPLLCLHTHQGEPLDRSVAWEAHDPLLRKHLAWGALGGAMPLACCPASPGVFRETRRHSASPVHPPITHPSSRKPSELPSGPAMSSLQALNCPLLGSPCESARPCHLAGGISCPLQETVPPEQGPRQVWAARLNTLACCSQGERAGTGMGNTRG